MCGAPCDLLVAPHATYHRYQIQKGRTGCGRLPSGQVIDVLCEPNQPMKHSIAKWRTQGNIWDWLAMAVCLGMSGFHLRGGGGGVNRAPKNLWGGVQEKGSIHRHSSVIMNSGAKGADNCFEH